MNRCSFLSMTAADLIGLAFGVSVGTANAQDNGKKVILAPNAPAQVGPYSQAIQVEKTVHLARQVAIDPKSNQLMGTRRSRIRRGVLSIT